MTTENPDEITRRGLTIYETRLRAQLEPQEKGKVVAIHLDTGDYGVASTSGDAMRSLRARHPSGPLLLHIIGAATAKDFGLVMRMRGTQPLSPMSEAVK